jgi:hypothetical protein
MPIRFESISRPETDWAAFVCARSNQKHTFTVLVHADDGRNYLFATAQFLDAVQEADDAAASPEAPPERMRLRFGTGEITLHGWGLEALARHIGNSELESLQPVPLRYARLVQRKPIIVSILVRRNEEL